MCETICKTFIRHSMQVSVAVYAPGRLPVYVASGAMTDHFTTTLMLMQEASQTALTPGQYSKSHVLVISSRLW